MILIKLAFKSLKNRLLATILTLFSIGFSIALLLSVEKMRASSEEGFTQTISQVDLIVGARTSPLSLLLYTVFNVGSATNNISWQTYEHFKNHDDVEWTIPYSLGDSHRGFRVVGTNEDFFKYYRFRGTQNLNFASGNVFSTVWDVVLGAEVAKKLNYHIGSPIVIAHGVTKGAAVIFHEDKPFRVVGILEKTGTALDQAVYVTLEGMEAIHLDWKTGAPPTPGNEIPQDTLTRDSVKVEQVTAFFVRTKSRILTLRLQREINTYTEEALLSVIPGVTLAELWRNLSYVEQTLKLVSLMVILVGFMAMLIAILTSLNERRREMAILRSLGLSSGKLVFLFVLESVLLTAGGIILGFAMSHLLIWCLGPWIESEFGVFVAHRAPSSVEIYYLLGALFVGFIIGLIPALRAHQMSLKDGLSNKL